MKLEELQQFIKTISDIDTLKLDDEAIRTAQLHGEVLELLMKQSLRLQKEEVILKHKYLERWRYYMGKQTDEYYREYGTLKEKVLKTDVAMYLDADIPLGKATLEFQEQKVFVETIKKAVEAVKGRSHLIREAIKWRVYQGGG